MVVFASKKIVYYINTKYYLEKCVVHVFLTMTVMDGCTFRSHYQESGLYLNSGLHGVHVRSTVGQVKKQRLI